MKKSTPFILRGLMACLALVGLLTCHVQASESSNANGDYKKTRFDSLKEKLTAAGDKVDVQEVSDYSLEELLDFYDAITLSKEKLQIENKTQYKKLVEKTKNLLRDKTETDNPPSLEFLMGRGLYSLLFLLDTQQLSTFPPEKLLIIHQRVFHENILLNASALSKLTEESSISQEIKNVFNKLESLLKDKIKELQLSDLFRLIRRGGFYGIFRGDGVIIESLVDRLSTKQIQAEYQELMFPIFANLIGSGGRFYMTKEARKNLVIKMSFKSNGWLPYMTMKRLIREGLYNQEVQDTITQRFERSGDTSSSDSSKGWIMGMTLLCAGGLYLWYLYGKKNAESASKRKGQRSSNRREKGSVR